MSHSDSSSSPAQSAPVVDAQYVQTQMEALYKEVQKSLVNRPSSASAAAAPLRTVELPRIRQPSTFTGAMGFGVDDWVSEMVQQFSYYGSRFTDGATCVRFAASYFTGAALHWWERESDRASIVDWSEFVSRLHKRFRPVQAAMLARQRLGKLSQRAGQSVNQYTSSFQITLTPIIDMGDADQVHHYVNGLIGVVAAKVWERHPVTLKEAIDYAVSIEAMSHYGRSAMGSQGGYRGSSYGGGSSSSTSTSAPMDINNLERGNLEHKYDEPEQEFDPLSAILAKMESMEHRINALGQSGGFGDQGRREHDRSRISDLKPGDIARMQKEGKCFRCKKQGHMKNECPQRPKA
jgi:hypothetical protein